MFSRFMTYRRFYVWRARYNYVTRGISGRACINAVLLLGVLYSGWIIWKLSDPPVPRVHPETARVQVRMMAEQVAHNIAVAMDGGGTRGTPYTTAAQVRAAARRSIRVREVYLTQESRQLQAHMLADVADYIKVSGVCKPYLCWHVGENVARLRRAHERTATLEAALRPVLGMRDGPVPKLGGDLERLQSAWSENFHDVSTYGMAMNDVQVMHEKMMTEYPRRAPMPWLSRLLDRPVDPTYMF
ncbi:hypothetical protein FJU31_09410 [Stenotrophomonas cyclobalanopsidis]|uniref:Transmembrane protein n=1 Tax=Stenotrophomonas cyclobalanopsidis TaxID=2771362 RepID=A0ABQ6T1B7_9GAMM|nr:hypothetical protein [Stenotrophomonas cyclobalanopsidis]KAA8999185.1 hypothetical protein FJU31_09410 [Stenotrophomonas cyclobalanopsidis]